MALANAYAASANEILGKAVVEYREKRKVADFQKCAYHCFIRASKLMPSPIDDAKNVQLSALLWNNLALLCQSIVSAPMNGLALKNDMLTKVQEMNPDIPKIKESEYLETKTKNMYRTIVGCLKNSLLIDPQWAYYLSLAHAYRKIGQSSTDVIHLYMRGIFLMPRENITKDQETVLDPIYKCCSFITKSYYREQLSASDSLAAFDDVLKQHQGLEDQVNRFSNGTDDIGVVLPSDPVLARSIQILTAIKKLDKKKWYHRPYFRVLVLCFTFLTIYRLLGFGLLYCLIINKPRKKSLHF